MNNSPLTVFFQTLFFVCVITSVLTLSSCQSDSKQQNSVIRYGLYNVPVSFDPRYATDAISSRINRLLYQSLVDYDQQSQAVPALASWEMISATHYRFTLKKAAKFHHGKDLTMADVKATYDSVLYDKKISPHRNALNHIQQIKLIDENHLDFILSRADPLFPSLLVLGIMPKDLLQKNHAFNIKPIGSGNFRFLQWPYDSLLLLERLRDQQKFEFIAIKDPTVRVLKLLNKEIDILQNNLPSEQIEFLKKRKGIMHQQVQGSNYSYIGFNLQDEAVGDLRVRQAIAYAIDRDAMIKYVLGNAATKAQGFFPPNHWLGLQVTPTPYAPDHAKDLLAQLGYGVEKPLNLTYKTSSNPFSLRKAAVIQQQLAQVGINMQIKSYDWGTFYNDIKSGKFQLYSLEWVGVKSPDIYKYVFHSKAIPPKGANRGRLKNAHIDTLIEQADASISLSDKKKLYQQLQQQINEIMPYVSLWYMANICFYQSSIQGYSVSSDGVYDALNFVSKAGE